MSESKHRPSLPPETRLAATYSIVAQDRQSGEIGVAVQSSYFSVGTDVSWAEAGVGAVATQSITERSYGPLGLERLKAGASVEDALASLLAEDAARDLRQVAIIDAKGNVTTHTGAACVPACGHIVGDGVSVQGNMLQSDKVWEAMIPAFEGASGELADRLLAALVAAEVAGGDVRGRQSAALLVVGGSRSGRPWEDRRVDLHVEDDPNPLHELKRLLTIHRAYDLFEEARRSFFGGDLDAAVQKVERARALQPGNAQFAFWTGVALANAGRPDEARRWLAEAFADHPGWRELARRMAGLGLYSGDPGLLES